jgi:hypothetical protein
MDKDKREALEVIADSLNQDPIGINEARRIKDLSPEEKRREYLKLCSRINEGRKAGGIGRFEAASVKDVFASVYHQHPNSHDIGSTLQFISGLVFLGGMVYVGYQGIIRPIIDYFSR